MALLTLSNGMHAQVDEDDLEAVSRLRWHYLTDKGREYAVRHWRTAEGKKSTQSLHRFIMQPLPDFEVDHIDGNGLNCRRYNMRVCTHAQNAANMRSGRGTSRYIGVSWDGRGRGGWRVYVGHLYVGRYQDEIEAALARDRVALQVYGEFARLNYPLERRLYDRTAVGVDLGGVRRDLSVVDLAR